MRKNSLLLLFVFLSTSSFSDERVDELIECSALYTFFSLAGPIMSTKTKLLYDAADFWIEADMTSAQKYNFEISKENLDAIAKNKNKLLQDFEIYFDNGSLFKLQKNISLECGTPLPGEYTPDDIKCMEKSIEKVSQYLEKSGMNKKIEKCDALTQTFVYSEVRNEIVKKFREY